MAPLNHIIKFSTYSISLVYDIAYLLLFQNLMRLNLTPDSNMTIITILGNTGTLTDSLPWGCECVVTMA